MVGWPFGHGSDGRHNQGQGRGRYGVGVEQGPVRCTGDGALVDHLSLVISVAPWDIWDVDGVLVS